MQYFLIVTRSLRIPRQVQDGLIIERTDHSTTHEEADVTVLQQAYQFILNVGIKSICVICIDTYVFVLLAYFFSEIKITSQYFHASNQW